MKRIANFIFGVCCIVPLLWAAPHNIDKTPAIIVNAAQVAKGDIPDVITALGTLSAISHVGVSSEVAGRISGINFKSGQEIAKGMPIVQLDNEQAKSDYQSAVTNYQLAEQKYNRSKLLVNEAISKQELAVLKADAATKQADVQSKLADLNEKQILAPFSGILGAFQKEVGDYVSPGDTLVTLVNTTRLQANYNLPEQDMPELKMGQLVTVKTNAYPNKVFYGTVTFVSPTISQASHMVSVQAEIDNKKGLLSPGMFVHLSQQVNVIKNANLIPLAAISADIKGYYVYVVSGNKAVKRYITTGMHQGAKAQVTSGLKAGDSIVVAGQQKLEDGSFIQVQSQGDSGS